MGAPDEAGRLGVLQAARGLGQDSVTAIGAEKFSQQSLFEFEDTPIEPRWVRVDTTGVRVENVRAFGGPWLALKLIEQLKADVTTVKRIVEMMEKRYGKSDRNWVMDRGMTSEDNLEYDSRRHRSQVVQAAPRTGVGEHR